VPGSERTEEERRIELLEPWDKELAVLEALDFAARIGFGTTERALIASAVSELATNILRYAGRGEILLRALRRAGRSGVEVLARDEGPGIEDLERALREGFTTERGSLGLGMSSVRRIMDDFEVESSAGRGTRVRARKWRDDDTR